MRDEYLRVAIDRSSRAPISRRSDRTGERQVPGRDRGKSGARRRGLESARLPQRSVEVRASDDPAAFALLEDERGAAPPAVSSRHDKADAMGEDVDMKGFICWIKNRVRKTPHCWKCRSAMEPRGTYYGFPHEHGFRCRTCGRRAYKISFTDWLRSL